MRGLILVSNPVADREYEKIALLRLCVDSGFGKGADSSPVLRHSTTVRTLYALGGAVTTDDAT